ncbi:MAG TPA: epoxyqueuosine reductase QueH [bacterium]|nr:epoxyqueuosine reductase QueH [bacterium]
MKSLLLHACCAPCLSAVSDVLYNGFDGKFAVLFYNPNIDTRAEHDRRLREVERYLVARYGKNVELLSGGYEQDRFEREVVPFAATGERGERCTLCYAMRLSRTFEEAAARGMTHAATTLTVSPHKDAARINKMGLALERHHAVRYLSGTWEYRRSFDLCREYAIYRQDYCGCRESATERDQRKKKRGAS